MIRTDSFRGILQSLDVTFETVQPFPFQILLNLSSTNQPITRRHTNFGSDSDVNRPYTEMMEFWCTSIKCQNVGEVLTVHDLLTTLHFHSK